MRVCACPATTGDGQPGGGGARRPEADICSMVALQVTRPPVGRCIGRSWAHWVGGAGAGMLAAGTRETRAAVLRPPDGTKRAVLFRLFGTVGLFNKLQTQKKTVVLRSRGGATQERHQGKFPPPLALVVY